MPQPTPRAAKVVASPPAFHVEQTLACYEEAKRKVSGAAEVSAVSVYWANRTKP